MKEEFDFDKVGKQMPYKVPSDFFDKITAETLAEAQRREQPASNRTHGFWRVMAVAASIVLMLAAGYFVYTSRRQQQSPAIAQTKLQTPGQEAPVIAKTEDATQLPDLDDTATKPEATHQTKVSKPAAKPDSKALDQDDMKETLDDVLASVSDDELLHLAAIAESDLYVYEQTID